MNKPIQSYRVLLKETEIASLIEVLKYHRTQFGLPDEATDAFKKLVVFYAKVETGLKTADYVPVANPMDRRKITLDALGASIDEKISAHSAAITARLPAELTPEQEDELEEMSRKMLAEFVSEGNPNVILEDRRAVPRSAEEASIDAKVASQLFKSL